LRRATEERLVASAEGAEVLVSPSAAAAAMLTSARMVVLRLPQPPANERMT
jgi:hypothetical protein